MRSHRELAFGFALAVLAGGCSGGSSSTGGSGGKTGSGGMATTGSGGRGSGGSGPNGTGGLTGTGGDSASGGTGSGGQGQGGGAGGGDAGASGSTGGTTGTGGRGGSAGGGAAGRGSGGGGSGGGGGPDAGDAGNTDAGTADGATRPARVLLYSFSTLNIASVPAQIAFLKQKLESWQYQVDESKDFDPTPFTDSNLARYAAVGMINTCFWPFGMNNNGVAESQALQKFMQQGGGLFGTHCADVTFQSVNPAPLYNQLIGGRANSENTEGPSDCRKMGEHPTIAGLPETFSYTGNLDNSTILGTDVTVLVRCRWPNAKDVAVSWVRTEGGRGRVFFTNFAKEDKDLKDATLGDKHIIPGLAWVLGR